MTNKTGLVAALVASTALATGVALADNQNAASASAPQTAAEKSFSKLSTDSETAYKDLMQTRLAIFDGDTAKAKTTIDEADAAFAKAKTDDSVYMKSEHDLMTPQQMAAKQAKDAAKVKPGADAKQAADTQPSIEGKGSATTIKPSIAWLPVDGAVSLNEDYSLDPSKAKAVAKANENLKKGDRKGALDTLKLADVNLSVALEVVPLNATLNDVHQAASLIDAGKFYEGSQVLRNVQTSARFDVSDYVATPKGNSAGPAANSAHDTGKTTTN